MLIGRKNLRIYSSGTNKMLNKTITVSQLASRLGDSGISSPVINAEIMLSHLLGLRAVDLYTNKISISLEDSELLEQMITRRINGEPLQYITGKTNFYGNDIVVREGVFIPRPETEILVDTVIAYVKTDESLILDLCTGSGNIAISLTKSLTHCKIIASDISETALKVAGENARLNRVFDRIAFIKADLLSVPGAYRKAFDIIVCNPPYVRCSDTENFSNELRREPIKAFYGGTDGMDFYMRIAEDAPGFLKDNGLIALEIPDNSRLEVEDIIMSSENFSEIRFFSDLNNIERVVIARLKG